MASIDQRPDGRYRARWSGAPPRSTDRRRPRRWKALAAAVPDRYRALIAFAVGMGLRQGNGLGLTLDRADAAVTPGQEAAP